MLYEILKPLAQVFYRVYYTFEIKGHKKTPFGAPIILSPNHTNAFIDPIIIAILLRPKIRFFARGDVFKGGLAKWVLNDLNISPMYRIQEGYSEVKKNDKTFEECRELLSENKIVLMFPEAICVQEKRLQSLKKGLSRIIFQTEETFDFKKNVWVVPIGLNYSDAKKFRSQLFINFGEPISLKSYEEFYKQDKVRAINDFTKMLEREMAKLIIVIKNKDNDKLIEGMNEIYLHQLMIEKRYHLKSVEKQYYARKEIAEMVNYLDEKDPILIESLKKKIIPYLKELNKHQLRDHLLRPEIINKMNIGNFIQEFIIIWLGIPIYGIGLFMNYLPFYITKKFVNKKIKQVEFMSSVYVNMAMLLWVPFYGIQLLAVALIFRSWPFLGIYAVVVPILGWYVLKFYPVMKKIFGRWHLLRMVRKEHKTVELLLSERAAIMEELKTAKKEYLLSVTH